MSDMADRIKQARIDAGFPSATEAARRYNWPVSTYLGYENGDREPGKLMIQRISDTFRVPLEWLMTGRLQGSFAMATTVRPAAPPPAAAVPIAIMGRIGAGAEIDAGVEQVPAGGYYDIQTVIPLPAGAIGFEVVGDSMWPRYDPGDVIVCLARGVQIEDIPDGEEAAVRLDDGRRFLKRLLRSTPRGVFNLESHNAPPIRGVHIDWAADVIAIIRSAKWRRISDAERRRLAKQAVDGTPG